MSSLGNIEPRFAVSYLGKKLGPGKKPVSFSKALGAAPRAIVQ